MFRSCARGILLLPLLVLLPYEARAADPLEDFVDPAVARTLTADARALIQRGKYSDACPKLEASLRLEPGIATQFELADCNERLGNITTAWSGFRDVAAKSKAANQSEREKSAKKRAQALEPRLPKLVVQVPVPNAVQGLEVKRDGVPIESAAWGTTIRVDPGIHRITATAPGKQRWVMTVQTAEGASSQVEIPRLLPPVVEAVAPREVATTLDGPETPQREVATTLDSETSP